MKNKKGFTLVELMTTVVLISIISMLLIRLTITLKTVYIDGDMKTTLLTKQGTMTDKIYKDLKEKNLTSLTSCGTNCVNFNYTEGTKKLKINISKKILTYGNYSIKLHDSSMFGTTYIDKYTITNSDVLSIKIPIYNRMVKGDFGIYITYQKESFDFDYNIVFNIVDDSSDENAYKVYTLGSTVDYNPVSNQKCTTYNKNDIINGTSTCYRWRVITVGDSKTKNKITLQMDHNLESNVIWVSKTDYNDNTNYGTYGKTNKGPITALNALATSTSGWNNSLLLNYTYDTTGATSNYGTLTCTSGSCTVTGNDTPIVTNLKARMITGEEVTAITKTKAPSLNWTLATLFEDNYYFSNTGYVVGNNTSGAGNTDLSWLIENTQEYTNSGATANTYGNANIGYWTLSPVSDAWNNAWIVSSGGSLSSYYVPEDSKYGIRPVIDIHKDVLE